MDCETRSASAGPVAGCAPSLVAQATPWRFLLWLRRDLTGFRGKHMRVQLFQEILWTMVMLLTHDIAPG
jgi:hypothetical protein